MFPCNLGVLFGTPDLTIALRQRENFGWLLDPALLKKELDLLVAEALDVEGAARRKAASCSIF